MRTLYAILMLAATAWTSVMAQAQLSPQTLLMLRQGQTRAAECPQTVYLTRTDGTMGTLRATPSEIAQMAAEGNVSYIHLTSQPQFMLDKAKAETGAIRITQGEGLAQPYTGKGVVVGIVDAGFDYTHPAFRNHADGKLRIARVWEQGTAAFPGCQPPEAYGYGIQLTTPEDILRAQADSDINSHGTHVAAMAAGSDTFMDGLWQGTAPEADIVLVALDQSQCTQADITNAVEYIFAYATEQGKPCVVNLSLGNHDGPHDGTSYFDRMADQMQGPGRLIVGASGNHRKDKFHICHTFASSQDAPLRTFIHHKITPSREQFGGTVQLWANPGCKLSVELSAYSTFSKADKVVVPVYPAQGVQTVQLGSYATGTMEVASEINPDNGKLHIVIRSSLTSVRNNYAVALTLRPQSAGTVDIWADNTWLDLQDKGIEGFTAPSDASTIAEIGGTGKRILTVGAYVTRNDYQTLTATGTLNETLGALASFSSVGPTADGRIKPDVTAPGCYIISALSSYDASGTKQVAYTLSDDQPHEYGYMQGTSMSAPLVTGIVATWLEACPTLSPEMLHDIVASTARTDDLTGSLAPSGNGLWGHGRIDAHAGLLQCLAATGISAPTHNLRSYITVSKGILSFALPHDTPEATLTVASLTGTTCHTSLFAPIQADRTYTHSLASLPKGIYLITLTTPTGTYTTKWAKRA